MRRSWTLLRDLRWWIGEVRFRQRLEGEAGALAGPE